MSLSASSSGFGVIRPSMMKKLPVKSVGNTVSFCRVTKQSAGTEMNKKTLFGFGRMSAGLPVLFHGQFSQPSSRCWGSEQQGEWEGLGSLLNPTLDTPPPPQILELCPLESSLRQYPVCRPKVRPMGEPGPFSQFPPE